MDIFGQLCLERVCNSTTVERAGGIPASGWTMRLHMIEQMGYVDYYLIVHDFVDYAKSQGIPVGPGRGSGAGSLAAYCIGITDIDPDPVQPAFRAFSEPGARQHA